MINVAVVGIVGIPACYGGFESLVENLTKNSSSCFHYTVFCSSDSYGEKFKHHNNAKLIYLPLKANGLQSILYDILSLIRCIFIKPDVVLVLGVSGCLFLPIFKFLTKSKVITNIDGLEWKREKWNGLAKYFLKLSEHVAVKFSDVVVTDNKAISEYVLSTYSIDSKIIAYGGDHAIRNSESIKSNECYALGLCRIEPENNVHLILEAYSRSGGNIKFIGNWNASDFGRDLKHTFSQFSNIELLDPIYDLDKLFILRRNAQVYIHGHSAGGTNPSLVEMMHFGIPIIAFDCSFNRYSTDNKAHYFSSCDDLIYVLNTIDFKQLELNAINMKEIALKQYTWKKIASAYESLFV